MQLEAVGREAEVGELQHHAGLVQDAHDDALAGPLAHGDGAHADVDVLRADLEADAPVLRQALLGDVEPRHDLHARHDAGQHALRRRAHLVERAVDAVAHHHLARVGLDVNVAGALLHGLDEERVHPADDLRVLVALEDVGALVAGAVRPRW
jgi:hypothetical protein